MIRSVKLLGDRFGRMDSFLKAEKKKTRIYHRENFFQ